MTKGNEEGPKTTGKDRTIFELKCRNASEEKRALFLHSILHCELQAKQVDLFLLGANLQ
jgi:hypothetical protein